MPSVKVSSKYQVVIPEDVRRGMQIKPGQEFEVWAEGNVIKLVRVPRVDEMRGAFPGIDTTVPRDPDRV